MPSRRESIRLTKAHTQFPDQLFFEDSKLEDSGRVDKPLADSTPNGRLKRAKTEY